jgi:GMP synthase (glutamine-hydrolysing)
MLLANPNQDHHVPESPSPTSSPSPVSFNNGEKPAIKMAIILTCCRPDHLVLKYGTVQSDFTRLLSQFFELKSVLVYEAYNNDFPSPEVLSQLDLLVIPGSFHMVTDTLPWIRLLEDIILQKERRCWLFGVCFGMQLACKAYGGQVDWNPNGVEVGVSRVHSPFFQDEATVLQSHDMHVARVPCGFQVVASNKHTPVQAVLSVGHRVYGVQFHPDFSKEYFAGTRECRGGVRRTQSW